MNLKEFIIPFSLTLATFFTVQYFLQPSDSAQGDLRSGQEFVVAAIKEAQLPLQREVVYEENFTGPSTQTAILTNKSEVLFSTIGASIDTLRFKHMRNGVEDYLVTLSPLVQDIKESPSFLVALQDKTPVIYELVSNNKEADRTIVSYKATGKDATIYKKFTVFDDSFKLQLELTIEPKEQKSVQPRLFIPQPYLAAMGENNVTMALVNTPHKKLEKRKPQAVLDRSWIKPHLFGIENRYFIHALVADRDQFAVRGYFTLEPNGHLAAILEGPTVSVPTTWTFDFYCGPKIASEMALVDSRLEATLDYGWFGFLSKGFIYLLNFIYSYVPNYGLVIILLTFLTTLVLLPFTLKSSKSLRKSNELRQKMQYIEQRYKNDPEALAREKAEAIKKYGIPEMAGCLPLLMQIPMFIGLNRALSSSFELYQAPFFGWITDLSAKDPYYVLPLLAAVGMVIRTASAGDPRQRVQAILLAIIVAAVTSSFAAGLTLYICVSTWLGLLQTSLQKAAK